MKTAAFSFIFFAASLAAEPPKLTEAIRADIRLMQERISLPGGTGAVYATDRGVAAARRVFAALPIVGMARQEVVAVLGTPSESVTPSGSPAKGRLVYRLDRGYDGVDFILTLDEHSRVTKVTSEGYD